MYNNYSKPTTVHYVDALAGAGKTTNIIHWAVDAACRDDRKIIIAQPSIYLLSQTLADIQAHCSATRIQIQVSAFHSCDDKHEIAASCDGVVGAITEHLRNTAPEAGEIILVTHAAFQLIPYFHRPEQWTVVWDEVIDPIADVTLKINASYNREFPFDGWFETVASEFADCWEVRPREGALGHLHHIVANRHGDELYGVLQSFCSAALAEDRVLYVKKDALQAIRQGLSDTERAFQYLEAYSVLQASFFQGYRQFIVMSALFETSTLYALFKQRKTVRWMKFDEIGKLRYDQHPHANIRFEYLTDRRAMWSKALYETPMASGGTLLDHCEAGLADYVAGKFVFKANKGKTLFADHAGACALPYSSHGLNVYQHDYDTYVNLAAYNSRAQFYTFCRRFGLDEIANYNRTVHLAYQDMMRTSIRKPDSTTEKLVILPTKQMCEDLAVYFPNSAKHIGKCPAVDFDAAIVDARAAQQANGGRKAGAVGRSNLWSDDKQRKRVVTALKRATDKQLTGLDAFLKKAIEPDVAVLGLYKSMGAKTATTTLTLFANTYRSIAEQYEIESWDYFVHEMRKAHQASVKGKTDNILICPATFDVTKSADTHYGAANVDSAWGMFIDYDSGPAGPECWHTMFPDLAKVIYSTYSSSTDNHRYRVVFPTNRQMTAEEYAAVAQQIAAIFMQRYPNQTIDIGGKPREVGIDTSKLTASSLFYIPCQAKTDGKSFFDEYEGEAICVDQLLANPFIAESFQPPRPPQAEPIIMPADSSDDVCSVWDKLPKARQILDSMCAGDRSYKATQVAGIASKVGLTWDEKQEVWQALLAAGIDKGAQASAHQYLFGQ